MAKDDYYVIVAKILVYLYKKYKCIEVDEDYIRPRSEAFPIEEKQLFETIDMMAKQQFIIGTIIKEWSGSIILVDYHSLKITPQGIDYLQDNSKVRKVCEGLKEALPIIQFFM